MEHSFTNYQKEFEVAVKAAKKAGEVMDQYAGGKAKIEGSKRNPNDIFTEADLKAQKAVVETVRNNFPDDSFLGEENLETGNGRRKWVIDPIDGTTNFQAGIEYFCTSIALQVNGDTCVSVVHSPETGLNRTYYAVKDQGAFKTESIENFSPEKLVVSDEEDLNKSLVCSRITNKNGEHDQQKEVLSEIADRNTTIRYIGSGALELCKVASGSCDGFISDSEALWDFGAAQLIVREAGGKVELRETGDEKYRKTVVSNGRIQQELLEIADRFY